MPKRLILASASPRRRELLSRLGLPFEAIPSCVDEGPDSTVGPKLRSVKSLPPREHAEMLAWQKVFEVWLRQPQGSHDEIILGADTIVVTDHASVPTILGKPANFDDSCRMLRLLSGSTHTVMTGLAIARSDPDAPHDYLISTSLVETQVRFRELTPELIEWYIGTGEPFDKAGGYGIQGCASVFVEAVEGDYFNVVGLPIQSVAKMLEQIGIEWWRGPSSLD